MTDDHVECSVPPVETAAMSCPLVWPALVAAIATLAMTFDARAQLAVADEAQTVGVESVLVDVLANDVVGSGVESVTLIGNPAYGTVVASGPPTWMFLYRPLDGLQQFRSDEFRYQLRTPSGITSNAVVRVSRVAETGPEPEPEPEPDPVRECIAVLWWDADGGEPEGLANCDE